MYNCNHYYNCLLIGIPLSIVRSQALFTLLTANQSFPYITHPLFCQKSTFCQQGTAARALLLQKTCWTSWHSIQINTSAQYGCIHFGKAHSQAQDYDTIKIVRTWLNIELFFYFPIMPNLLDELLRWPQVLQEGHSLQEGSGSWP